MSGTGPFALHPTGDPSLPIAPPSPTPDALKSIAAQLSEQSAFQIQQLEAIAEGKAGVDAIAQIANARGWVQGAMWTLKALGIDLAAICGAQAVAEVNAAPELPAAPVEHDPITEAHVAAIAAQYKEQEVGLLVSHGMAMNDALRLSDEERREAVAKISK